MTDLPKLPTFHPLPLVVPSHKLLNWLLISFSKLDAITSIHHFNLFLTKCNMGQLVAYTISYIQQHLRLPEQEQQHYWQPVTDQDVYLWLAIEILVNLIGVTPEWYWMKNGVFLPKDGLLPAAYLGKVCFQEICHFTYVSQYNSPIETPKGPPCSHSEVDIELEQLQFFPLQYWVPGSNVVIDQAMNLFTGRSIHITKMAKKPISPEYKFVCSARKGYVWEFNPSSNAVGWVPVDVVSCLSLLTDTGKIVHHLIRCLHQSYQKLSFNVYMYNISQNQHLQAEFHVIGIGVCGTCRQQFWGCPKELKIGKNAKLTYYFHCGAVNYSVATLLLMVSSPVTMMSTINPLSGGEDSLVLSVRQHPGNKTTNASGANSTFLSAECQNELDIPVIVDTYNQHKVGVDVADLYWTYFDTQLISRWNWYPLFNWILEYWWKYKSTIGCTMPTHSSQQACCGLLRKAQYNVVYSQFTEIFV